MSAEYKDTWITAAEDGLTIRWYYFPLGTKHIRYPDIQSITRLPMEGVLTGRGRIWGTSSFRYWASLDPQRPKKRVAYVIDVGRTVKPFLTPADPGAFESAIGAWCSVPVQSGASRVI
jgi:hypothetical protein